MMRFFITFSQNIENNYETLREISKTLTIRSLEMDLNGQNGSFSTLLVLSYR